MPLLSPAPVRNATARQRAALTHAVHPRTWRAALTLDLDKAGYAAPIRVGIAVGITLVVGGLLDLTALAGFAALGSLVSAFCRADPYPVRLGRLVALGIGITVSTVVGGLVGIVGGGLLTEIVIVSLLAGAAAAFVAALRVAGPGAVVFVFAATGAAGAVTSIGDLGRFALATGLGAIVGVLASLAPWLWDGLRRRSGAREHHENSTVSYESVWRSLARTVDPTVLGKSARIMFAAAASAGVAVGVGLDHPMWAAMGAVAALQGVSYHVTVTRGLARLIGNATGGALAAALLAVPLGYWGAVAAIVVLQIVAEITAPINYALCSTAVTPMALLLTALGAGLTPQVAIDRLLDTLIGIVVGIVIAAVTITRGEGASVPPPPPAPRSRRRTPS